MGLREEHAAAARSFVEDAAAGFGWPITVRDPDQLTAQIIGTWKDMPQTIDPQTGMLVTSREATVTLSMAGLTAAGFTSLPKGISEKERFPWVVRFVDTGGQAHVFKVREARPNRTLGIIVCALEAYAGTDL